METAVIGDLRPRARNPDDPGKCCSAEWTCGVRDRSKRFRVVAREWRNPLAPGPIYASGAGGVFAGADDNACPLSGADAIDVSSRRAVRKSSR